MNNVPKMVVFFHYSEINEKSTQINFPMSHTINFAIVKNSQCIYIYSKIPFLVHILKVCNFFFSLILFGHGNLTVLQLFQRRAIKVITKL